MPKESLPIYQIPDFESNRIDSADFYYSPLGRHLKTHKFIQKPHKHDFYILLLFTSGTGTHSIDFQNYEVTPGTAFFLRPGQVHSWQLSEESEGHILFFSSRFYSFGFPTKNLDRFPFFISSHNLPILILNSVESMEIDFLFTQLANETTGHAWSKKEILRSYTEILLVKLCRSYQNSHRLSDTILPAQDQLKQLESMIESHFRSQREASYYAEKLHLSLKQLNRLTKSSIGKTISQLIFDRVILESQRLLTYSEQTISEIASQLGFEDPSYFTRLFRKKVGITPEHFRKSIL